MDGIGNNITAVELSKDVNGAEHIIKEHNEQKVWLADSYLLVFIYLLTHVICVRYIIHYVYVYLKQLQHKSFL